MARSVFWHYECSRSHIAGINVSILVSILRGSAHLLLQLLRSWHWYQWRREPENIIKVFIPASLNNITVPDPCQVFSVFNSFHSLFSWSISCLITTSYPSKSGALCNKATVKLIPSTLSLYSGAGGPSWDSSITLLTNISSLAMGGERVLGFHKKHLHVNGTGCWTAPLQSLIEAPASLRCHVPSSPPIFPLKYKGQ